MISAKLLNCYGDELTAHAVHDFEGLPETLRVSVKKRHFRDTPISRGLLAATPAWFGVYNASGTLLASDGLISIDALRRSVGDALAD